MKSTDSVLSTTALFCLLLPLLGIRYDGSYKQRLLDTADNKQSLSGLQDFMLFEITFNAHMRQWQDVARVLCGLLLLTNPSC